jgi:iron(III) transport system permease protein
MVFASWRRLSPSLIDAEPRMRGWTVVKTLLWGAGRTPTAGAAFICFALALANFTIPVLFQIPVFSERIWLAFNVRLDAVEALQNALPCLVVVLAFLWVAHARGWREPAWPAAVMDEGLDELRSRVGLWGGMAVAVAFGILAISLLWPLYTWLGAERTWVEIAPAWAAGQAAVWRSLGNAATTATLAVATAAWLVSRKKVRHERLGLLGPGLWVPFLLPGVVLGIAVNHFTSRWAGDSEWPVVVSLFLRYFGFAFAGMAAVVRSLDTDQLHALRLVSGSWWPTWRAVLWPQAGPRILAVWYIVYLLALWDVETGIVVAPPGGETLAMRIFNLLHYGHASQVKALCVILTGLGLLPGAIIQLVSLTTGQRLRHTTGHSS